MAGAFERLFFKGEQVFLFLSLLFKKSVMFNPVPALVEKVGFRFTANGVVNQVGNVFPGVSGLKQEFFYLGILTEKSETNNSMNTFFQMLDFVFHP